MRILLLFLFISNVLNLVSAQDKGAKKEKDTLTIETYFDADIVVDEGLFDVYVDGEKVFFALPKELINKDMLLVTRIAEIPSNLSAYLNAGSKVGEQIVRWEKNKNKILLRIGSFTNTSDEEDPIHLSVERNNFEPIVAAFDIETMSADSSKMLIEVSSLFHEDVKALTGLNPRIRKEYNVKSLDKGRSFIDTVRSYPINIEVKHLMTYNAADPPAHAKSETLSLMMNQSFILLPKTPMRPRLYDERVGWFTVSQYDYSSDALKSDQKRFIRRWRLEPGDPAAYARGELVEPVKPIIYYLDPATPLKWRKYFKQGIEDWNECFETAGFKNAIIARDPPTKEEDPEFSPEDARYSVVRYVASTTRNAVGPSVSDPRTGEIIESDIIWYHNHLRSYRNRYLLETGAANPRARTLNTPEEDIGEMMRRVIAHEIGHALGLPHNMKASSAYPVDSLRSPKFTNEYGIATTIMDYARYNYVAQPGDGNNRFVRMTGPYDHYSINWGYRYLPNITEPDDELPILRSWINEKEGDPVYMFGSGRSRQDPDSQTECIGDDNVKASEYGLLNLRQVTANLVHWTSTDGANYQDLEELYGELLGVWRRYIYHVITNIGGVHQTYKTTDQSGPVYAYVSREDQERAIAFVTKHIITSPNWLIPQSITSLIGLSGSVDRLANLQAGALDRLLDDDRMLRLSEAAAYGADVPEVSKLVEQLTNSLFAGQPDNLKRRLQRAYIALLGAKLKEDSEKKIRNSDLPAIYRDQLIQLYNRLENSSGNGAPLLRAHYTDLLSRIDDQLDPQ